MDEQVRWENFGFKPHPAQKEFIAYKVWEFHLNHDLPEVLAPLMKLTLELAKRMVEQPREEDRGTTMHSIQTLYDVFLFFHEIISYQSLPKHGE